MSRYPMPAKEVARHWAVFAVFVVLIVGAVALSSCTSPAYQKYVKPITAKIGEYVDKVGAVSDKYRDPPCESDCAWQRDAFDHE